MKYLLLFIPLIGYSQPYAEYGYYTPINFTGIEIKPLTQTKAGVQIVSTIQEAETALEDVTGFLNTLIAQIPSIPTFELDTIEYSPSFEGDSLSVKFIPNAKYIPTLTIGKYFHGGRWGIGLGNSLFDKDLYALSIHANIYPIELLSDKYQYNQWLNVSRLIYFGADLRIDAGNPTLFVPSYHYGGLINVDLLGGIVQGSLYYKRSIEVPFKAKELRVNYGSIGAGLAINLTTRRYDNTTLPIWLSSEYYISFVKEKSTDYVKPIDILKVGVVNTGVSVVNNSTEFITETASSVGFDVNIDTLASMSIDTVKALNNKQWLSGHRFTIGLDEPYIGVSGYYEKHSYGAELRIYPLGFFKVYDLKIKKSFISLDIAHCLELNAIVEHNSNKVSFLNYGKGFKIQCPVILNKCLIVTPRLTYSEVGSKVNNYEKSSLRASIAVTTTFAPTVSIPNRIVEAEHRKVLSKIHDPELRRKMQQKWKHQEGAQRNEMKNDVKEKEIKRKQNKKSKHAKHKRKNKNKKRHR